MDGLELLANMSRTLAVGLRPRSSVLYELEPYRIIGIRVGIRAA